MKMPIFLYPIYSHHSRKCIYQIWYHAKNLSKIKRLCQVSVALMASSPRCLLLLLLLLLLLRLHHY
jgi:hypothetical protein